MTPSSTPGREGSPEAVAILLALHEHPGLTTQQLAGVTRVPRAALDQALDGLRKRGRIYSEGRGMACRWYKQGET